MNTKRALRQRNAHRRTARALEAFSNRLRVIMCRSVIRDWRRFSDPKIGEAWANTERYRKD